MNRVRPGSLRNPALLVRLGELHLCVAHILAHAVVLPSCLRSHLWAAKPRTPFSSVDPLRKGSISHPPVDGFCFHASPVSIDNVGEPIVYLRCCLRSWHNATLWVIRPELPGPVSLLRIFFVDARYVCVAMSILKRIIATAIIVVGPRTRSPRRRPCHRSSADREFAVSPHLSTSSRTKNSHARVEGFRPL